MSWLLGFIPMGIAAVLWWLLALVNRRLRWLRIGELIFWDAIITILVYLVWLRWN